MSDKLVLRNVVNDDLPIFFEHQLDQEANYMAAFTAKDPTNQESFMAHWHRILADKTNIIQTIIFNGQVAGSVSSYEEEGKPEVTYWLGKQYWGKGIATWALKEFLAHHNPTRPIYARVAKDNLGSRRVLEKCGFKIIGESKGFANARGQEIEEFLLELMEHDGAAMYSMVSIERANVEDVPEIKQVLSETWRATYGSFLSQATINTVTSVWHSPDRLAAEIQNPRIFFGVARTGDGAIIGLTTVGQISDDTVVLSRLYVHPQYQRQGVGSQLLQAGITAFPATRTLRLEVEENNHSAYTFYHHHGFHETESKEERVEGDVIKVMVMEKFIA